MRQTEVARQVEQLILNGTFPPGTRLPTEAELAVRFGVSRSVLREAVARLRSDGLVRSRQGQGTFVTDLPTSLTFRFDAAALSRPAELARLFELRLEIEPGAAALAARYASAAQRAEIAEALDALHRSVLTREGRAEADATFHAAVARASGNHFFFEFVQVLTFCISRNAAFGRASSPSYRDWKMAVFDEHAAVHEAILRSEPDAARAAMTAHLLEAAKRSRLPMYRRSASGERAPAESVPVSVAAGGPDATGEATVPAVSQRRRT